jgi:hypothetical protein
VVAGCLPAARVTVLPNPVEVPPDPPPRAAGRGPARFVYTGRLVAEKGLDDLLTAAGSRRTGRRRAPGPLAGELPTGHPGGGRPGRAAELGRAARQRVAARHDPGGHADVLLGCYRRAIARAS